MIKFPNINKFDVLMETISTGPNHSASVSVKKGIYSWGNGEGGRLGLNHDEMKKAKAEPLLVIHIMELLKQNRQNVKEGRRAADGDGNDSGEENIKTIAQQDKGDKKEDKTAGGKEEEKKDKFVMDDDAEDGEKDQDEKPDELDGDNDDAFGEFEDVEKAMGQDDQQPQEKLNLISLGGQSSIEAHIKLQKLIRKEKGEQLDEDFIIRFDDEILKDIDVLLK